MRPEAALSLLFASFLVLPPGGGFAVKGNEGAFLAAVAGCGALVGLLQVAGQPRRRLGEGPWGRVAGTGTERVPGPGRAVERLKG